LPRSVPDAYRSVIMNSPPTGVAREQQIRSIPNCPRKDPLLVVKYRQSFTGIDPACVLSVALMSVRLMSVRLMSVRLMSVRKALLQTTMFAGVVGAVYLSTYRDVKAAELPLKAPASAAPSFFMPAVDGVNWKVGGLGGSLADRAIGGAQGSLSLPLGNQYGVQIDGTLGSFDGSFFGNVGGHLFWRNPSQGLLGVYVNHTHWDQFGGVHVTQFAGEGEYYWQRWTLQAIAGVEFGNSGSVVSGTPATGLITDSIDVKTRFFDKINLAYYLTDNWKAFVGHRYLGGKHALALGSEYALPLSGGKMASAFVEGRIGENDFHGVWGGLRFYFGQKDKPLIARHRQDDPINWDPDTLFSLTNSFNRSVASPTPTCPNGYINIPGEGCQPNT
jgi:hypothetical protein